MVAADAAGRQGSRLLVLRVLVLAMLATLLGRLWVLQVHEGAGYRTAASTNRTRDVLIAAPRGEVYDIRGRPLILNRVAMVVSVARSTLQRQPNRGAAVLARLAPVVGLTTQQLAAHVTPCGTKLPGGAVARSADGCWAGSPYQPVPVAMVDSRDHVGLTRLLAVQEHREDFPGVSTDYRTVRDYPAGTLAANTMGYLGPIAPDEVGKPGYTGVPASALVGRAGVEQTYDAPLRGTDGVDRMLVDKDGTVTGTASSTAPRAGDTLILSLDAEVQQVAETELRKAIDSARGRAYYRGGLTRADSGAVVVMAAKTGRVIALASYPSYDPAQFTGGISAQDYAALLDPDKGQPLLSRATQAAYAPASTFKAISSTAAVENGQVSFTSVVQCPGVFGPTGQQNFEGADLGAFPLRTAIVRSCDTNFYKFAYDAWLADGANTPVAHPKDPMINMALAFGLGSRTGIDLPGESPGLIPTRQWRQHYWEQLKGDFCAGAKNPAFDAARRARNRDSCVDGFRFRGGQATNFAIGQGETLVTPLQLATVYAAVANGGDVVQPTVARALVSPDGRVTEIPPTITSHLPVRPQTLAALRDALHGVTSEPGGTGYGVFGGTGLSIGGKTGTGQVNDRQDTSWFASFSPAQDPQLVVVAMVSQGGTGATTAAPLVRSVYQGIYGLAGQPAALPDGALPTTLPVRHADGTLGPAQ